MGKEEQAYVLMTKRSDPLGRISLPKNCLPIQFEVIEVAQKRVVQVHYLMLLKDGKRRGRPRKAVVAQP